MLSSETKRMKNDCNKALTVRFYCQNDSDLIDMAVQKSGLCQSDWSRQTLILMAEVQVTKGGILALILKNVFLVRRLLQMSEHFSETQISDAMTWSSDEFEKIINSKPKPNGDPDA